MKTLIFTAKSDYARFRCPYTTTSALTFLTIHPVAVRGLVGAVLGIEYENLYEYTKDIKVAIQVINPIYKDTQSFNLTAQSNNNKAANFQSRIQFLRDVKYRIFLTTTENKLYKIKDILENHSYIFTPYLGCSEHVARLDYEGLYDAINIDEHEVDTIVSKKYVEFTKLNDITIYFDRIPLMNSKHREYIEYDDVVIPIDCSIITKECEIYKVGDYNVFFL